MASFFKRWLRPLPFSLESFSSFLSHAPPVDQPPSAAGATVEAPSILQEEPDRVGIEVNLTQPGYLVLADTYYSGWQATVNGEAVEIMPANHVFRAIQLDRGEHFGL